MPLEAGGLLILAALWLGGLLLAIIKKRIAWAIVCAVEIGVAVGFAVAGLNSSG